MSDADSPNFDDLEPEGAPESAESAGARRHGDEDREPFDEEGDVFAGDEPFPDGEDLDDDDFFGMEDLFDDEPRSCPGEAGEVDWRDGSEGADERPVPNGRAAGRRGRRPAPRGREVPGDRPARSREPAGDAAPAGRGNDPGPRGRDEQPPGTPRRAGPPPAGAEVYRQVVRAAVSAGGPSDAAMLMAAAVPLEFAREGGRAPARLVPVLVVRVAQLTRRLARRPATASLVRVLPLAIERTVAHLHAKAARGSELRPAHADRVLRHYVNQALQIPMQRLRNRRRAALEFNGYDDDGEF